VAIEKVSRYLLAENHPVGKNKAVFFRQLGFNLQRPEALQAALLDLAASADVTGQSADPRGTKYVVDGEVRGPRGAAGVRTVWIVDAGATNPRLVTAYPIRRKSL
jgi:hypothetical protein